MVLSAGLMLAWCCDLIVAGEDTVFADVVGTRLGMCGVEYFGHPWEFGPRKAKELLLTGDSLGADEAHALGMVSKVFPDDELSDRTVEFARRIAKLPTVTALLIKESVNQTVDAMGFSTALDACFSHPPAQPRPLGAKLTGDPLGIGTVEHGLEDWRHRAGDPARRQEPPLTRRTAEVDIDYPPEAEAFRDRSARSSPSTCPQDWSGGGALPPDEREGGRAAVAADPRRRRAGRRVLAQGVRRRRSVGDRTGGARRGVRPRRRTRARRERPVRNRAARQHPDRPRVRGAEERTSCRASCPARTAGARASPSPRPARTWRPCGPGRCSTATSG